MLTVRGRSRRRWPWEIPLIIAEARGEFTLIDGSLLLQRILQEGGPPAYGCRQHCNRSELLKAVSSGTS